MVGFVISGYKWNDLDGDGFWDEGEPGLAGWTIYLDRDDDPTNGYLRTAVTDENGFYQFTGLGFKDYYIYEEQQDGWTQTWDGATVINPRFTRGDPLSGDFGETEALNFGNHQEQDEPATKTGVKFHDLDGDGVKDAGEAGVEGWTIYAYADDGDGELSQAEFDAGPVATDDTDSNGVYSLSLAAGSYIILEAADGPGADPWFQSAPTSDVVADGVDTGGLVNEGGYAITLAAGEVDDGNDFGNFQQATKTGTKWNDLDGDGNRETGEDGLSGWTIRAYADLDGDGLLDQNEYDAGAAAEDVTAAGGGYTLTLDPGDYVVVEVLQDDWTQSAASGADTAVDSVLDPALDTGAETLGELGYAITLQSGDTDTGNDFGNQPDEDPATKTGVKFHDLDGDGVKDAGEAGVEGWTIYAYADDGDGELSQAEFDAGPVATDDTDSNGVYSLSLAAGSYIVLEAADGPGADPWFQSAPTSDVVADGVDTGGLVNEGGYAITLAAGEVDDGNDFGNFQQATKTGTKWNDLDGDGNREIGEDGLSGWTIRAYADLDGDGLLDQNEYDAGVAAEDVTAAGGGYTLTLDPGDYVVVEVLQDDWTQSAASGADTAADSVLDPGLNTGAETLGELGYAITLQSGDADTGNDFGNVGEECDSFPTQQSSHFTLYFSADTALPGCDTNGDGFYTVKIDGTNAAPDDIDSFIDALLAFLVNVDDHLPGEEPCIDESSVLLGIGIKQGRDDIFYATDCDPESDPFPTADGAPIASNELDQTFDWSDIDQFVLA